MDVESLKESYGHNPAVKAICDHMAARDKNQNETKLHRIMRHLESDGCDFKKGEVIAAFRALEEAGCGKYVEGRHGWPSRFVWEAKSLHIAAAAKGQQLHADADDTEDEEDVEFIEHSFALRADLQVTFELPSDLSSHEAERLAAFIQSLPFGEEG